MTALAIVVYRGLTIKQDCACAIDSHLSMLAPAVYGLYEYSVGFLFFLN